MADLEDTLIMEYELDYNYLNELSMTDNIHLFKELVIKYLNSNTPTFLELEKLHYVYGYEKFPLCTCCNSTIRTSGPIDYLPCTCKATREWYLLYNFTFEKYNKEKRNVITHLITTDYSEYEFWTPNLELTIPYIADDTL